MNERLDMQGFNIYVALVNVTNYLY